MGLAHKLGKVPGEKSNMFKSFTWHLRAALASEDDVYNESVYEAWEMTQAEFQSSFSSVFNMWNDRLRQHVECLEELNAIYEKGERR